jgi:hypothetical protein
MTEILSCKGKTRKFGRNPLPDYAPIGYNETSDGPD